MKAALQTTTSSPLDEFIARCEAHARLVREGRMGFIDAIDKSQNEAVAFGTVADIGQDAVQEVMARAFAVFRDPAVRAMLSETHQLETERLESKSEDYDSRNFWRLCRQADERRAQQPQQSAHDDLPDGVAQSTLDAATFLIKQKDLQRLREWLAQHTSEECAAIWQYLQKRSATPC